MKILSLKNVSFTYQTLDDEINAIDNLSFDVEEGQFVSIIGPSGCGKTSVLSLIAGLLTPTKGEIVFNKHNIGYMLQKDQLFPWRTIEQNILLPLEIKKQLNKKNIEFADSLIRKYGLYDFKNNYPNQLSGGMRQRVALIRTLVINPDLLLLDEPFSALDYQTRLSVIDDVYKIIKTEKKTAILVTHDIGEAISMSDVIYLLTKRPAKLEKTYTPNISGLPLQKRENKEFSVYFEKIWKDLNK